MTEEEWAKFVRAHWSYAERELAKRLVHALLQRKQRNG